VFADCIDDLRGSEFKRFDIHNSPHYIFATFKNSSKNKIFISSFGFFASDNKTIMKKESVNIVVEPFGIFPWNLDIKLLNMDVQGNYFINCNYK
tara:strand:- start:284 stop:565 length:282 start_codon:yes stop_codon:yes gene_type:complete